MRTKKIVILILSAAALAACTTVQPPTTLATQARQSVERAESLGADENAPLVLREAQQYLAKAEEAMGDEEFEDAKLLLEKSMINSELAIARTNAEKSKRAAEEIEQNLDALQQETFESTSTDSGLTE